MLIAVASTDGEMVNEHFGRATRFWIFDVEQSKQTLIMVRSVEPLSTGNMDHPFEPEKMEAIQGVIKDCERVYCTKIGDRPRQELEKAGITPVIYHDSIGSIQVQ
jgi:predicted Fe-Mo cluster-binding NifX family protein